MKQKYFGISMLMKALEEKGIRFEFEDKSVVFLKGRFEEYRLYIPNKIDRQFTIKEGLTTEGNKLEITTSDRYFLGYYVDALKFIQNCMEGGV